MGFGVPTTIKAFTAQRANTAPGVYNQMTPELAAYLASLPPAEPDLSFLNDPNNPYLQAQGSGDSGSGSSSSGVDYGPPPAPAVAPILETSAEWTAYLNALGLEKNQFAADIERQRSLAKSQTEYNLSQVAPQYDTQRRGITSSAEGRGMTRSGAFQRDLAENKANETRTKAGIQQGLDSTQSGLESQLAQKNMDIASRTAQQRATMIGQGYQSNPMAPLDTPEFRKYAFDQQMKDPTFAAQFGEASRNGFFG